MFTSPGSPRQMAKMRTWFVLFFEAAPAMSFDDLDAMAVHDWPVAAPHAYPVFGRTTLGCKRSRCRPYRTCSGWKAPSGLCSPIWMSIWRSITERCNRQTSSVSVPRVGGEPHVHLRLLEFDAMFREDHRG